MDQTVMYPKACRKSIQSIVRTTGVSVETAYAMMLLTAALMDLSPDDVRVLSMVLEDCGVEEEKDGDIA